MARILVAEDSATQAVQIRMLLEAAGFLVQITTNGQESLNAFRRDPADLVLTDLDMPVMNGLELVETMCKEFPRVPVVLMTAFGSEEVAIQALQRGAASYVSKLNLARDLVEVIGDVLSVVQAQHEQQHLGEFLADVRICFRLPNDISFVMPVVTRVQDLLAEINLLGETERMRVAVALEAALHNAIFHGNLELSSEQLRKAYGLDDGGQGYDRLLEERRNEPRYCQRQVHLDARVSRKEAILIVRDEGLGFDVSIVQSRDVPSEIERGDQRGLLLMSNFMDEVSFNVQGNEVTLVKRGAR